MEGCVTVNGLHALGMKVLSLNADVDTCFFVYILMKINCALSGTSVFTEIYNLRMFTVTPGFWNLEICEKHTQKVLIE